MSQFKSKEEAAESGVYIRKIQSFVKREGRLTRGQEKAIETNWETMGLEHKSGLLDMNEVFGRTAPVVLEIGFGMGKSLVTMAKNEPDKDFIGIEVHRPGIGACLADAQEQGVTNLRVYEHDAVEVHMATDWENYAEHMLEIMAVAPGYKNLSSTNDYVPRPEQRPLTKFEQRGHRLGHGVWDLMFEREA